MSTYSTTEPVSFYAGDTVKFLISLTDYPPSDGWQLFYKFMNASGSFEADSEDEEDSHLVTLAAADSADITAGTYKFQAFVENIDSERYTVRTGEIEVKAALDAVTAFDTRSDVKIIFDAIEATISGRATQAQLSRRVGDRQLQYMSLDELIRARNFYKDEYLKESGAGRLTTIKAKFTRE